jgi:hypothetical protein
MGEDYSAVPPPAATGSANANKGDNKKSNPDFSDALAKAKALAAKFATQATQAPDQSIYIFYLVIFLFIYYFY